MGRPLRFDAIREVYKSREYSCKVAWIERLEDVGKWLWESVMMRRQCGRI